MLCFITGEMLAIATLLSCGLHLGGVSPIRHAPLVRAVAPRAVAVPLDGYIEDAVKVLYDGQCMVSVCIRRHWC